MQLTVQLALLVSSASAAWMQPPAVHRVAAPATSRQACTFMQAATEVEADASAGENYEFEAEVTKVMDIIINSLYSDKDIFLRELISNAADACDKKRFLSLTEDSTTSFEGRVRIVADKEANTLTIEDNGIGMSKADLKNNLGKIAQSGTKKFTEALGAGASATNLIGQFGVGFYSAFLVASKVTVVTKAAGEAQLRWESEEASSYTISEDSSDPIEESGTRLILSLKEEADKYTEDFTLRDMLKRYSEFVAFPIELWSEKTTYETVPDPDAEAKEGEPPPTKSVPKTTQVWDKVNSAKPLWMRAPKDVSKEEYDEFYKTTFKAYDTPDAYTHFSLEGQVEFRALLFLPSTVPWELSQDMFNEKVKAVKLFVKRVFISDSFEEELLPRWLSFLKGVVDSDDLPLNVSREILQKSRVLSIISKRLVRKSLDMFKEIAKDEEKFATFTKNFGRYIKVGLIEDKDNKDALLKLASFASSDASIGERGTTIPEYKERMKEGQKQIYYISGSTKAAAMASPVLDRLKQQGYEVLFALDQIDEISLQGVGAFEEVEVIDASKENADLGELSEEEKESESAAKEEFQATCDFLKQALGTQVDKCEVSSRLTTSPSALVQPQWGVSPQMQRFMRAQAAAAGQDDGMMGMASNLEINPRHPAVLKLKGMVEEEKEAAATKDFACLLFDVAAVSSGYEIKDTAAFARRVVSLMSEGVDMTGFMPETSTTVSAPGPGTEVAEAADVEVITPDGEVVTPPEDEGVTSWYDAGKRL
jgi:heat shock protein beta